MQRKEQSNAESMRRFTKGKRAQWYTQEDTYF